MNIMLEYGFYRKAEIEISAKHGAHGITYKGTVLRVLTDSYVPPKAMSNHEVFTVNIGSKTIEQLLVDVLTCLHERETASFLPIWE